MKTLILALMAATTLLGQPAATEQLLAASAADFQAHQPPTPVDIRNVHPGYVGTGDNKKALICGEFLPKGETDWMPFATVKTSGYEQWLGAQANGLCIQPQTVLDKTVDLSPELKSKLDIK